MTTRHTLIAAASLLAAFAAQANTISYTSNAVGPVKTSALRSFLDLQQFDPSLGLLESVVVTLNATVSGTAQVESKNNTARTLTAQLGAAVTLGRPDGGTLVVSAPLVQQSFNATAFDGVNNYDGMSGITYNALTATHAESFSSAAAADLALFTGTGVVHAPISASANSGASGAGNLSSRFTTLASGQATVTYTYSPLEPVASVPEPRSWALMLAGVAALGSLSRRRRQG
jgi:hypothetical protein